MNAVKSMIFCSLWMIFVWANIALPILCLSFVMILTIRFLSHLVSSLLNDKSQFAKFFLIFSQVLGLISGLFMTYSAKSYGIEIQEKALNVTINSTTIELSPIQEQGVSMTSGVARFISLSLFSMWLGIQTQVEV